jgi:adenylyltransferase/sulfurtransferase
VLGVLPGVIGVIQAIEAVKLIVGIGDTMIGRLLLFDALKMKFRELRLRKDPACPICGPNRTIHELIDYDQFCGVNPVGEERETIIPEITVLELKEIMDQGRELDLIDVREPMEWDIARIPGARLIPLGQLPQRMHELDSAREIYLQCKSGIRSAKAWKLLNDAGFRKIKNVHGGIEAWAQDIDPSMPRY